MDPSFSLWKYWALRVVAGSVTNLVSGENIQDLLSRDRAVSTSIVQRVDPQFWGAPARQVNAVIEEWVSSASQNDIGDAAPAQVPPQNENAIAFQANPAGLIELAATTYSETVRSDQDTVDRYEQCVEIAREVLHRCGGSNTAARMVRMLENYLSAAGTSTDSIRPSLFVQRGERLRQEIGAYGREDTMLPPIADDLILDLKSWQSAHNMLVGLDPVLMTRDSALIGPDTRVADVSPAEIADVASDAERSGLLAANVAEIVLESAANAPEIPDPRNRRTIWNFETGRNLIIETFNVALRHPAIAASTVVIGTLAVAKAGVPAALVAAAAGAVPAARFLLKHREWIETRLGDTPTWKSLFVSLVEWLQENTPIKSDL